MNNTLISYIDYGLLTIGVTWGLDNVESALGVIILVIQLIWLLIKLGAKIYAYFKGTLTEEEVDHAVTEITKELEKLDTERIKDDDDTEQP